VSARVTRGDTRGDSEGMGRGDGGDNLEDTTSSALCLTLGILLSNREVVSCKNKEGGNKDKLYSNTLSD